MRKEIATSLDEGEVDKEEYKKTQTLVGDAPSDPSVGKGSGRCKPLPSTRTRMHNGKAISYA